MAVGNADFGREVGIAGELGEFNGRVCDVGMVEYAVGKNSELRIQNSESIEAEGVELPVV